MPEFRDGKNYVYDELDVYHPGQFALGGLEVDK